MPLTSTLGNYLLDLDLVAPETLNLEFIQQLQAKHLEQYSFNNIAVLLGEEISLDLDVISNKIVTKGLGGYCFEHNKLTFELLKALGYNVKLSLGRVLMNQLDREPGRTHRLTILTLDNRRYLVDTGFGGDGPITPLELETDIQQKAGINNYRVLARDRDEFDVQLVNGDDNFTLYRFDLANYYEGDCAVGNYWSYKNPKAPFVNNLMVALKSSSQTLTLFNRELIIRDGQGEQKLIIDSPSLLLSTLVDKFGVAIEPIEADLLFKEFLIPG